MTWEPTNELRWIKRLVPRSHFAGWQGGYPTYHHAVDEYTDFLQQKWIEFEMYVSTSDVYHPGAGSRRYSGSFEWRDVPTEVEK